MAQKPIAMEQLKQLLQLEKDGVGIREMARRCCCKMRYVVFIFIFLVYSSYSYGQDSARIYFLNKQIPLPAADRIILDSKDASFAETLFSIGGDKYIYMRLSVKDSFPVELGQLGLYFANHKFYLLREGFWIIEKDEKKMFYQHLETDNDVEEFPVSLENTYIDQVSVKKYSGKKKRYRAQ